MKRYSILILATWRQNLGQKVETRCPYQSITCKRTLMLDNDKRGEKCLNTVEETCKLAIVPRTNDSDKQTKTKTKFS